jgi:hypothetical protein
MKILLPVKPGSISDADKALLREAGVVVFEHPAPAEVNLLGDDCDGCCGVLLGRLFAKISEQVGDTRSIEVCVKVGPEDRIGPKHPPNSDGHPPSPP